MLFSFSSCLPAEALDSKSFNKTSSKTFKCIRKRTFFLAFNCNLVCYVEAFCSLFFFSICCCCFSVFMLNFPPPKETRQVPSPLFFRTLTLIVCPSTRGTWELLLNRMPEAPYAEDMFMWKLYTVRKIKKRGCPKSNLRVVELSRNHHI